MMTQSHNQVRETLEELEHISNWKSPFSWRLRCSPLSRGIIKRTCHQETKYQPAA
jgi:hypothetical protein